MHYEMLAAYTRTDLSAYYGLNAQIHDAINRAAKNPVLTATYNQVNARLGGQVEVHSVLGQGTRFTLRFPAQPAAPGPEPAPTRAPDGGLQGRPAT